uniref:ZP domain-containing protein n=1 Tax=Panagrellus redivivus TaxID=6233 RepID=A0A7E4UPH9_PANRE
MDECVFEFDCSAMLPRITGPKVVDGPASLASTMRCGFVLARMPFLLLLFHTCVEPFTLFPPCLIRT